MILPYCELALPLSGNAEPALLPRARVGFSMLAWPQREVKSKNAPVSAPVIKNALQHLPIPQGVSRVIGRPA
jgi:hypothetical protein